jgi:hypothetical protein
LENGGMMRRPNQVHPDLEDAAFTLHRPILFFKVLEDEKEI